MNVNDWEWMYMIGNECKWLGMNVYDWEWI